MPDAGQRFSQRIDSIGQRIQFNYSQKRPRQAVEREKSSGQENQRHDQEINDQLEGVEILEQASDSGAQQGENQGDDKHEKSAQEKMPEALRPETDKERQNQDDHALQGRDCRSAQGAADHDLHPRYRRHQHLL